MRRILFGLVCISFLAMPALCFAQNSLLEAYGLDTVAGYDTFLRTSKTLPDSSVIFDVRNPDGKVSTFSAVTSENGVAQTDFSGYYTNKAGVYAVSARLENGGVASRLNSFTVYPGDFSATQSIISPTEQLVRTYDDDAVLTVKLVDSYQNPIDGHLVRLISSSDDDVAELTSDELTDSNGEVSFRIFSGAPGAVTYTAYDATTDKILESRAKVVYFNPASNYGLASAFGNSSLSADSLLFENIPDSISAGESINFTLSARDAQNQTVSSYNGTVGFAVVGNNAIYVTLPDNYTFTAQDMGSHTFSLALSFLQSGSYLIEARDTTSSLVYGEQTFVVTSTAGASLPDVIILSNPIPGTYSNNIQVISGTAPAGSQVKIFDNNLEITSLVADVNGSFSYTTSALVDGTHAVYAASVNNVGTIISTSSTVNFTIDTAVPGAAQIILEPSETVNPGDIVIAKLYAQEALSKANLVFQGSIYELTLNQAGYYETPFVAPIEFGEYPLTFTISDQLGNESVIENTVILNVGGLGVAQPPQVVLGDVTGLTVAPSNNRVTLTWQAPSSAANLIQNYRIHYGISPNQLTEAVDTFTNSTTWYIPNLRNGAEYYFGIVAVDTLGNTSEHFSNIVSTVPNPATLDVPSVGVTLGTEGSEILEEMQEDVSATGPEMTWLVLLSLIGGIFYVQTAKRRALSKCRD